MSHVILRGHEAVHYAEAHGVTVHYDGDDTHPAAEGLSLDEARELEAVHPRLLWVPIEVSVNSGEQWGESHPE